MHNTVVTSFYLLVLIMVKKASTSSKKILGSALSESDHLKHYRNQKTTKAPNLPPKGWVSIAMILSVCMYTPNPFKWCKIWSLFPLLWVYQIISFSPFPSLLTFSILGKVQCLWEEEKLQQKQQSLVRILSCTGTNICIMQHQKQNFFVKFLPMTITTSKVK